MCKAFGYVEIRESTVVLFYDKFDYRLIVVPDLYMTIYSALWQGNNLLVNGYDAYGTPRVYLYSGFDQYRQIK